MALSALTKLFRRIPPEIEAKEAQVKREREETKRHIDDLKRQIRELNGGGMELDLELPLTGRVGLSSYIRDN